MLAGPPVPPTRAAIDACAQVLTQAHTAPGASGALARYCPRLTQRLSLTGAGLSAPIRAGDLAGLRALLYPPHPVRRPTRAALGPILRATYRPLPPPARSTLWARFWGSVRKRLLDLLRRLPHNPGPGRLLHWLRRHAGFFAALGRVLAVLGLGVVLLLAVALARRIAGRLPALNRWVGNRPASAHEPIAVPEPITLPGLEAEVPEMLQAALRLLRQRALLRDDQSRTNRECVTELWKHCRPPARFLAALVRLAERASYAERALGEQERSQAYAHLKALFLDARSGAPSGIGHER